jgi:hypothetical protein
MSTQLVLQHAAYAPREPKPKKKDRSLVPQLTLASSQPKVLVLYLAQRGATAVDQEQKISALPLRQVFLSQLRMLAPFGRALLALINHMRVKRSACHAPVGTQPLKWVKLTQVPANLRFTLLSSP